MKKLFDKGCEALGNRRTWEQKQSLYYEMRHDGLRRRNKPWPTAADLHFPLVDMNIRKAKPFWESQATAADRLASFVALQDQQAATTSAAADFFDFELKQHTNFETELVRAIDGMLLRGRGILKCVVDPFDDYKIICEAIEMPFIIMLAGAEDFEDADEWIHVRQLTVAQYKRDRRYVQDEAIIKQISGSKDFSFETDYWMDKERREGINYSTNPNEIILWEHWQRTMGGWTFHTYSPLKSDLVLRRPMGCPYKVAGKPSQPFYSFKTEIKDKGWYAPRGLAELNAPFERYVCKLWNEKTDAMTFANRPLLTTPAGTSVPNTANIRAMPGEILPSGITAVQFPQPPFSFDQEISFARSTAEQVSMMPDFGILDQQKQGGQGEEPTATKVRAVTGLSSVGTESNGRIFRRDLSKVYRHIWGMMLQFKRKELTYYMGGELKTLPEQALHDSYLITPDGSPDQWNKQLRQQRADMRLQKFSGSPNVDQDALVEDSLAADDPLVAQKLFIPGNVKSASEAEDEAVELLLLQEGYPAAVKPNEDHAARINVLLGWLQKQGMMGVPVNPIAMQRVQQHLAVHMQILKKTQPDAFKAMMQQIQAAERPPNAAGAAMNGAGPGRGMVPNVMEQ